LRPTSLSPALDLHTPIHFTLSFPQRDSACNDYIYRRYLQLPSQHRSPFVYVDDVNLLGDNTDTVKKITTTLTDASNEAALEVNTEKTKYMLLSRHQNAGQSHDIKTGFFFFYYS
jgi:hypothetical protein